VLRARLLFVETVDGCAIKDAGFDGTKPDKVELTLGVGISGDERHKDIQDLFVLKVCSPQWLLQKCELGNIIAGQYCIFTDSIDQDDFEQRLKEFLNRITGETVEEVFSRVSRFARSEFDGLDRGDFISSQF